METEDAVRRLAALAQDGRLQAFRTLVRAGADGLAAGQLARAVGVPANTLSSQLQMLSAAGLVRARRDGRSIIYAAEYDAVAALVLFLTEDCCQGHPEACAPLARSAALAACRPLEGALS